MSRRLTRRQALAASAASLGYLYTAPAFSAERVADANSRLRVVGVGVGGKGDSDIDHAGSLMEVVALCDIDEGRLGKKAKKWAKAKTFYDFRKLFDDAEVMKTADAFTVSTPDHNHAVVAVLAMRAGKHVYCQKPLTHDVYEAHLMRAEAKKNKVCTQMGNQGTAANGLRKAVELVRAGEIGEVKEVHVWTNRPWTYWKQAPDIVTRPKGVEVPKGIHWDEFLGTAPERPYNPQYHPMQWRGFWDFGTGAIGDMACHTANMAFMALKLKHPTAVAAEAGDVNPETAPAWAHVTFTHPQATLHWYEGKKDGKKLTPPAELVEKALALDTNTKRKTKLYDSGSILIGSKGLAYSPDDYGAEVFFSTGAVANRDSKLETMPVNNKEDFGQKEEWVKAIKAGKPELALSNFDYAGLLTANFLLGNVAIRAGKPFAWDGEACKAKDLPEADKLVRREYRKGWDLIGSNS